MVRSPSVQPKFQSSDKRHSVGNINYGKQPDANQSEFLKQNLTQLPEILAFDADYFPQYSIFLLSEEEKNINNFKERIEQEKTKINQDFEQYKSEIINLIEDLKIDLLRQVDQHFKPFIDKYKEFKQNVIEFKNIKLDIPVNNFKPVSKVDYTQASNQQLLKELEEIKYKNQLAKMYQYISEVQREQMNKIINSSQDILQILTQAQPFYQNDQTLKTLNDLKNNFAQNISVKFDPLTQYVRAPTLVFDQKKNLVLQSPNMLSQMSGQKLQTQTLTKNNQILSQSIDNAHLQFTQPQHHQAAQPQIQDFAQFQAQTAQMGLLSKDDFIPTRNYSQPQHEQLYADSHRGDEQPQQFPPTREYSQNLLMDVLPLNSLLGVDYRDRIVTDHADIILCFCVVDGDRVCSGSKDTTIGIWDLNQKRKLGQLVGHKSSVCCLGVINYQNNKRLLMSGSDHGDQSIIIWDLERQEKLQQLSGHQAAVVGLVSLDDGQTIISSSYDKSIIIWNFATGSSVQQIQTHTGPVISLCLTKDKGYLVSSGLDNLINIWKINYKQIQGSNSFEKCYLERQIKNQSFACSLNTLLNSSERLVVGTKDGKIIVYNLKNGMMEKQLNVNVSPIVDFILLETEQMDQNAGGSPFSVISCANKKSNLILTDCDSG